MISDGREPPPPPIAKILSLIDTRLVPNLSNFVMSVNLHSRVSKSKIDDVFLNKKFSDPTTRAASLANKTHPEKTTSSGAFVYSVSHLWFRKSNFIIPFELRLPPKTYKESFRIRAQLPSPTFCIGLGKDFHSEIDESKNIKSSPIIKYRFSLCVCPTENPLVEWLGVFEYSFHLLSSMLYFQHESLSHDTIFPDKNARTGFRTCPVGTGANKRVLQFKFFSENISTWLRPSPPMTKDNSEWTSWAENAKLN